MESSPYVVEDLNGVVKLYSDGSVYRADFVPMNIPFHDDPTVVWKQCLFDPQNNLILRLYKPVSGPAPGAKFPIVYFFHGGGFCAGSCTWANNHNTCQRLASGLQALVVAPDYRLAPEHRLPAAVDDALNSLKWLKSQALSDNPEAWLRDDEVDCGRVWVIGDSSGGNMAHHLAVQLGPGSPELAPVKVRGYVLMAPFFGGTLRTKSEAEGLPEPQLNLDILDRLWMLSLPIGKNADHPLANPFGPYSKNLETVKMDPMLIIAGEKELLKDRVENYAMKLKSFGKKVEYAEFEGQYHGFFINDPYSKLGDRVLQHLESFISKLSG
ncbi:OLC1v1033975C1 [Oldenlandia corymbosa var. corymbosa]|uniref:OLC1v1033975C1 n=1 Tax=Oldenlandia corymbosa var. corymbosa TaxID=529605 RepID=A0AAV1CSM8_OLDCO|nr:OLC1v1033975C1 [Oldenlandia corymbosa var. corymbosa]